MSITLSDGNYFYYKGEEPNVSMAGEQILKRLKMMLILNLGVVVDARYMSEVFSILYISGSSEQIPKAQ